MASRESVTVNSSLLLLSLPQSVAPSGGDPQVQLEKWLVENLGLPDTKAIHEFEIPSFKIGTLDNLVHQSEELHKLDAQFQSIVAKAAEIIVSLYDNNQSHIAMAKKIEGDGYSERTAQGYFESFKWNTSKYRIDKPIPELVELITKETFSLDSDLRTLFNNYSNAKSTLTTVAKRQTGNLSTRSLHDVVHREDFVQESEYLTTVLIAVPKQSNKDFLANYETLTPMVVPRSANLISQDDEYLLYSVTLFKKFAAEFVAKCRESKWTPRDFKYSQELIEDLRKEQQVASQAERKLWGEIVRLSRTAYSDIIKQWAHLKCIRIFVESVLRYGLPPNFISLTIDCSKKSMEKSQHILINKFGYLGGNAFEKDKKGKLKGDGDLNEYGALVDIEYKPFVLFQVDIY